MCHSPPHSQVSGNRWNWQGRIDRPGQKHSELQMVVLYAQGDQPTLLTRAKHRAAEGQVCRSPCAVVQILSKRRRLPTSVSAAPSSGWHRSRPRTRGSYESLTSGCLQTVLGPPEPNVSAIGCRSLRLHGGFPEPAVEHTHEVGIKGQARPWRPRRAPGQTGSTEGTFLVPAESFWGGKGGRESRGKRQPRGRGEGRRS